MGGVNDKTNIGNILEMYTQRYDNAGEQGRMFNTVLYAIVGGILKSIQADANGNLITVSPADSYTLGYDANDNLTSITRGSDSKAITLGYTGDNLTSISDWA